MSVTTIRGLLALLILVPILIGFRRYMAAGSLNRLFLFYLLIGMITDLTMWYLIATHRYTYLSTIFSIYSLCEALFFAYYLWQTGRSVSLRWLAKASLLLLVPFWISATYLLPRIGLHTVSFDVAYEVLVAFLSGFSLLQLVENESDTFNKDSFWITLGLFFYCFCTFFIMGFLETRLANRVWFVNNIINLITYAFYSRGLWQLKESKPR